MNKWRQNFGSGFILRKIACFRDKVGIFWWYSILLFLMFRIGDLISLYIGVFYLPRALSVNELGAVDPLTRLAGFGAIPLGIIGTIGAKYLSTYHATGSTGKIKHFLRDMSVLSVVSAVVFIIFLYFCSDPILLRLNLNGPFLFLGLSGVAFLACWQPLMRVMLQGMQKFYTSSFIGIIEFSSRLLLAMLLIPLFHLTGYLFAVCFAGFITLVIGAWSLREFFQKGICAQSYYDDWREMMSYAWPVALMTAVGALQAFIEPFVIKHFLPSQDAAGYYMACRFGYIPTYFVGSIAFVLFPFLSYKHEQGKDTRRHLRQALIVAGCVSGLGTLVLGMSAHWIFSLRPQWQIYQNYSSLVWLIGLLVTIDAIAGIYITSEMACRRFAFLRVTIPIALFECVILYCSFGWAAFRPFLPIEIWDGINGLIPRTLPYAVMIMLVMRMIMGMMLLLFRNVPALSSHVGVTESLNKTERDQ